MKWKHLLADLHKRKYFIFHPYLSSLMYGYSQFYSLFDLFNLCTALLSLWDLILWVPDWCDKQNVLCKVHKELINYTMVSVCCSMFVSWQVKYWRYTWNAENHRVCAIVEHIVHRSEPGTNFLKWLYLGQELSLVIVSCIMIIKMYSSQAWYSFYYHFDFD